MGLEKLTIKVETGRDQFTKTIEALFNPNELSITRIVNWTPAPAAERDVAGSQFTYGQPATLKVDLLFDTYEKGTDVREHTSAMYDLTSVQGNLHRPPLCKLSWGAFTLDDFQWVVTSLTHRFTLFLANGTPVRATLNCEFKQWRSGDQEARLLNKQSADVPKRRTVRRGDTLSSIAGEEYQDPARWRVIAQANQINNPRTLTPGQVLVIPALRPGAGRK
ncbi:MAG TPA: LysM peptidoglycan-binding domain-containing protein [Roseiflexaceae bacterium]